MAEISQTTPRHNGVDHAAPLLPGNGWDNQPQHPAEGRPRTAWDRAPGPAWDRGPGPAWDRGPDPAVVRRYNRLQRRHERLVRRLRNTFAKRTLGSDQRILDRAHAVYATYFELHRVYDQLVTIERG